MRIAYIAPYQGWTLMKRRPTVRNLSLAARVKVEVIAELLQRSGHNVEILSQGEVSKGAPLKFYRAFADSEPFDPRIQVFYSSALPVRFLNGLWSGLSLLRTFQARHKISPYDAVLIYNFKVPQRMCARYAAERLGLPVVLEYEDDVFVNVAGQEITGFSHSRHLSSVRKVLSLASAGIGVTPHVLTQMPRSIPKLLLRGVVSDEIAKAIQPPMISRENWIAFSGTFSRTKGLEQLIEAWHILAPTTDWELHIAGDGQVGDRLRRMAANSRSIVFHGLLNRNENARLLCSAKIGINPHDLSATPGNCFAFKIIEYLAAGMHVISTPMGTLEPEIESGITYMPNNKAETIAATLRKVIGNHRYERTAVQATLQTYGPEAVASSLQNILNRAMSHRRERRECVQETLQLGSSGPRTRPKI
jgi:glycosyltransferase involved in cell wall biosynthesis